VRVLVAPDKFKDAVTAAAAAAALADGVRAACPAATIDICPLGDGGDGTGAVLAAAIGAGPRNATVCGPRGAPHVATWWWHAQRRLAIVEMAEASGLRLLPDEQRDAVAATTYGTGELLAAALDEGAEHIWLCVGGSATVDGGAGCLQALGWTLHTTAGTVDRPACGGDLVRIERLVPPRHSCDVPVTVLVDVDNPLLGAAGAAPVFAPQKGADAVQVVELSAGLARWAAVLATVAGRDVGTLVGGGAAGGLAAGLAAALGATLTPGLAVVAEQVGLRTRLERADLCLTGEGRLDAQTSRGKVVAGVAELGRAAGCPVVALVGATLTEPDGRVEGLAATLGLAEIIVITPPDTPLDDALAGTAANLRASAERCVRDRVRP
jgi:glycerate kinase